MVYSRELVSQLEALGNAPMETTIYRHMFGRNSPDRENITGARWNPPNTRAIYCGLTKEACLAEADHYIDLQPNRPAARRTLFEIKVKLARVVKFPSWELMQAFGASRSVFAEFNHSQTWEIGGVTAWLGNDALLIPSARCSSSNLVIYPENQAQDYEFTILSQEEV